MTCAGLSAQILKHHAPKIHSLDDGIFVSPETIQWGEVTSKSDMFSVATLMHVLFYQEWPFPYSDKLTKLQRQWGEGRTTVEKPPQLPDKVGDAMDIALEVLPSRRFKSWAEWIEMLDNPAELIRLKEKNNLTKETYNMGRYSKRKLPVMGVIPRIFAVILAIGIIGLTIATFKLSDKTQKEGANVTVPDVVGMKINTAQETLSDAKLDGVVSVSIYHYNIPEGCVIESKPAKGMMVKENRTVKLIISKGKGDVTVPDITGRDIRTATEISKRMGLNVVVQEEVFSYDHPKGAIISQQTTPNATVNERSDIIVTVSKGVPLDVQIKDITARNVRGITKQQREVAISFDLLEEAGEQSVMVTQALNGETKTIFQRQYKTQGENSFSIFADLGSDIQIYFNNDSAYKAKITEDAAATE